MTEVKIKFDNKKAADHFLTWLCELGEQAYWNWMECRESEEDGDITAIRFDYDFDKFKAKTECGRLDKKEE